MPRSLEKEDNKHEVSYETRKNGKTEKVVVEDYVQPQVKLDLWGGTSGEYQGFDRFGRIVDHLWRDYGASADADRFLYGYDRAGNRIWKENDVSANLGTPLHLDELYEYDELYRLINTQRGNLSANHDAITDKAFEQDWGLDATHCLGVRPVVGIKLALLGREVHRPLRIRSGLLRMVEKITNH